jgi:hypothetical protein
MKTFQDKHKQKRILQEILHIEEKERLSQILELRKEQIS